MARICFVELSAETIEHSAQFYKDAFGWETSFGPTCACTMSGDVDLGLQADMAEATRAPVTLIAVEDLEQSFASVQAAGAIINKQIFSFPRRPSAFTSSIPAVTNWQ